MDIDRPTPLLGGLTPAAFVRRHWQKKPLLVRGACLPPLPGMDRRRVLSLAAADDVESRLIERAPDVFANVDADSRPRTNRTSVRAGPLARRSLPSLAARGWTVLVQGVDLHDDATRALLDRFRFLGDARLDDVMISFATDGGGVGPHVDSYDVFLLQLAGQRRWRVGPVDAKNARRRDGDPLAVLDGFAPRDEWLLDPGDMLYLPPGIGHDGVAVGECITASIGFRAPIERELAAALAERMAERVSEDGRDVASRGDRRYRDAAGAGASLDPHAADIAGAEPSKARARARRPGADAPISGAPARVPAAMQRFAATALERLLADDTARERALGEVLSEPKPGTWFERGEGILAGAVVLDRRTRMLYDDTHVFVNGESYRVAGRDAKLLRRLADARGLDATSVARASKAVSALLVEWATAGWLAAEMKS